LRVTYLKEGVDWQDQKIPKRHGKSVCIQRFGAFGDMVQLASIFPVLKEQGYHICVNTTPRGFEILRNETNVDEFFLQATDQVPNHELGPYGDYLGKSFERFICLHECLEGSLLAMPGRRQHAFWTKEFRHLIMSVDYLEALHAAAQVPFKPAPRFCPSNKEKKWAAKYRNKLGKNNFVIMWSIAGSSVHKVYPHMDQVITETLRNHPDAIFILVGDEWSKIGEVNWEKHPQVKCKSGRWNIRESLTFAKCCDLVIGPETGVMNAVSFEEVPKILLLSHSTPENIGKSWLNTDVVEPVADCYPCHTLHYGFDTCTRDEQTGTAACAASIPPSLICRIIDNIKPKKQRAAA
jgi:ADP-heptose:LPS heptosyltransferase